MATGITDRLFGENSSVAIKAPVLAVATTPITLSGLQTINGYTTQSGDRVLITAQADPTTNGIYNASTTNWNRSGDFDGSNDVVQGTVVTIASAAPPIYYFVTTADPVIGTTAINFAALNVNGAPNYTVRTAAEIALGVIPANYGYPADPYVDPRRYGADPTGVLDSTTAVQTAINVAYECKGMVWIGNGCNFLCGALSLTMDGNHGTDGIRIMGSSVNGSRLTSNGNPATFITIQGASLPGNPQESPLVISNLSIFAGGSITGTGLLLKGVAAWLLDHVYIFGFNINLYLSSSLTGTIRDGYLMQGNWGLYARDASGSTVPCNLIRMHDCVIDSNAQWGIDYDAASYLLVDGCDMEGNGTHLSYNTGAIHIGSSINTTLGFALIDINRCWLESNYGTGILVDNPASGSSFISIRNLQTLSDDAGNAITVNGSSRLNIENSLSPNGTWTLNALYLRLANTIANAMTATATYEDFTNVATSTQYPVISPQPAAPFTYQGTSASTPSGTPVTLVTVPANNFAVYLVNVTVAAAGASNYSCTSLVSLAGSALNATALQTAAYASISVSGLAIKAQQNSGGPGSLNYSIMRIA